MAAVLRQRLVVQLAPLRRAGAAMLGLSLLLPRLPHRPGLPCPLRTITGVPCPMCGMTTSVEAGMRWDWRRALAANPFGLLAIMVAAALLVIRPAWHKVAIPLGVVLCGALASELFELHRYHFI